MRIRFSRDRFDDILLSFFTISLLAPISINSFFLVLIAIRWIVGKGYKRSYERLKFNKLFIAFIIFYIVLLLSLIYSSDLSQGVRSLETKLGIILIPLFLTGFDFSYYRVVGFVRVYVYAVILFCLFSLVSTLIVYKIDFSDLSYFSWVLPNTLGQSAGYYGIFVSFALIFLVGGGIEHDYFGKAESILAGLFLYIFLALLSSRMPIILVTAYLVVFFGYRMIKFKKERLRYLIIFGSIIILFGTLSQVIPYLHSRMNFIFNSLSSDPRLEIFKASYTLVKSDFLFGVGIGDVGAQLVEQYGIIGFEEGIRNGYNPHNLWFTAVLSAGVFGLLALIGIFYILARQILVSPSFFNYFFFIFFLASSFTESYFNRNKGVVAFSVFATLIFILNLFDTSKRIKEINNV
ncbi:MAG: O-antigen ligase family protein [Cyclobacteriaceae bacterium]